jgi:excisionase family DNA binding protein
MKGYYTTSQAAKLLSVSADTVLKWVRAGKIPSYRTPGGHSRIPAEAVAALLPEVPGVVSPSTAEVTKAEHSSRYCWDFYAGSEGMCQECRSCVAYKSQARRCYEMRAIPEEFGHLKLFCQSSCEECEFYQLTHDQSCSVLVVSRNRSWLDDLRGQADHAALQIEFAGSEYECAVVVEKFRPDFIVLDASFGKSRTKSICQNLTDDERIPFARIIITSRQAKWAEDCEREVYGWMEKPFSINQLEDFIAGAAKLAPQERSVVGQA